MKQRYSFLLFLSITISSSFPLLGSKIVGLLPVRNEQIFIGQCIKALSKYTDAIIVLDDFSTDNTVAIIESLAQECNVAGIIKKESWYRDEPGDRNKLLNAGRSVGGTHFVVIDADEMITANCQENNFLRNLILSLNPGDVLNVTFFNLWRSIFNYRQDSSVWSPKPIGLAFCDDGRCSFNSDFLHTYRIPPLHGRKYMLNDQSFGLMHFQFVNWRNLLIKQAWYRCLEHIRYPLKSVAHLNEMYGVSKNETDLRVSPANASWFSSYAFFDASIFNMAEQWREKQVLEWFDQHGKEYFRSLDIWDVDWGTGLN